MSKQYDWLGPDAWSVVPYEATTHPAICRAFARLAGAWHRDMVEANRVDPALPLTVFELGAGSGRFAHGFLRRYTGRVRYLATDRAEGNLRAAAEHPALRPLLADGRLALSSFDVSAPAPPVLPENAACAVIATYVFDTLPHDLFRVRDGQLEEGLVSLKARGAVPDEKNFAEAIQSLDMLFDFVPVERPRFVEASLERVLDVSLTRKDPMLLFPTAPLRALEALSQASGGRMLLLCADKAWVDPKDPMGPSFSMKGTLSSMTNFAAVADWARANGGGALVSRASQLSYVLARRDGLRAAPELEREFSESIVELSPEDRRLVSTMGAPNGAPLRWYFAALRTGGCDPRQVLRFAAPIRALAAKASARDKEELRAILGEAAAQHFAVGEAEEFPGLAVGLLLAFGLEADVLGVLQALASTYGLDLEGLIAKGKAAGTKDR